MWELKYGLFITALYSLGPCGKHDTDCGNFIRWYVVFLDIYTDCISPLVN